jgi:hypothetical protein
MVGLARLIGFGFSGVAAAASGAEFTPTLEFGVLRTDNLTQAPSDPEAATMWKLIPSFTLEQDSNRFKADAAYRVEAYHYDELGETETFNQFDGEFQAAIVPDRFFFNLGGMRAQAIVDPESNIPVSNFVLSANRLDVDEYHLGPSFTAPAGGSAIVSGEFQRAWYRHDQEAVGGARDYTYDTATVGVDNYMKRSGATWAARFSGEKADYELQPIPYEHRQASLELGFWLNDAARLFVVGGKETPWDDPLETDLQDSFWEAGAVRSSDRFSAEFAVGDRSFGSSRRGSLTYQFDRGDTRLSYSETPATNAADRFKVGGLLDPTQPDNYLYRPGELERYISSFLQWQLTFDLQRVKVTTVVFDEKREERTNGAGTPLGDEAQTGASVSVTWKFGAKLDLVFDGRVSERDLAIGGTDDFTRASLAGNYALGSRTRLTVEVQHWEQDSEQNLGFNYTANALSATVTRTFR